MDAFLELAKPQPDTSILDLGGTAESWAGTNLNVTLLNLRAPNGGMPPNLSYAQGDATNIPFGDDTFDIVFSNSMIEHLYTCEHQAQAAREAMRVGKKLWIQTPNRWFPIEPHFLTPFVHWLPKESRKRLVRNFTLWGLVTRPSDEYAHEVVDEINLLSAGDLRELFPGCRIVREHFLGLTKSLIVVR